MPFPAITVKCGLKKLTADELRRWQRIMNMSYETAAQALGMSRSGYAKLVLGKVKIDRRTALACQALVCGLGPWILKVGAQ